MKTNLKFKEKLQIYIKKTKKTKFSMIIIIILTLVVLLLGLNYLNKNKVVPKFSYKDTEGNIVLKATFVGDIMLGRNVKHVTDRYGYEYLFRNIRSLYKNSNYISGNFENSILLRDEVNYKQADKYICLHTNKESINALKKEKFTVLTIANNHIYDYTKEGLRDTIRTLEKYKMNYVGAGDNIYDALKYNITEINGIKIATLGVTDAFPQGFSATTNKSGVLTPNSIYFLKLITKAQKEADLVVVNTHWGEEYSIKPNLRQKELARKMVDAGADIIIGHHPHVVQSFEVYNNSVIFYSLGNFVFDQGWSRTKDSVLVNYKLYSDGKGKFEVIPLRINEATPMPTYNKYYQYRIFNELTKDVPTSNLWNIENGKLIININNLGSNNKLP